MAKIDNTPYKRYVRQPRIQYAEESFKLGMSYTNTPLEAGFSRMLVNYDLKDAGECLTPRAGLQVKELGIYPLAAVPIAYSDALSLSAGKDCTEPDGDSYKQIIAGIVLDTKHTGTNLYQGSAHVFTINTNDVDLELLEDIEIKPMVSDELYFSRPDKLYFRRPDKASIHGMELANAGKIARHVGTFGFNNSYYYFVSGQGLYKTVLGTAGYEAEAVAIKAISPKEAVLWGYNMLSTTPYTFEDSAGSGVIQLLGILPYDALGDLEMSPQMNQSLTLRCYYQAAAANTYNFVWDWKQASADTWTTFKTQTTAMTSTPEISADLSVPANEIMVRVTAYLSTDLVNAEKVMTVGFNFDKTAYGATANVNVETYDLSTATGMSFWRSRLVLYGIQKDPTILFLSDVNEPGYFPYPNCVDIFTEPIVHVTPFLDQLLVFTTTKLHLLTLQEDGLTWTKKTIQGNLDIKEWDVHLIQIVKNMVFFKSGNYFYMVVPRASSLTGDLTIAPIAKPISSMLDNLPTVITDLVNLLYDYDDTLTLTHYYNFLDFEDVHNMYVFQTTLGVYINVDLLYNTMLRIWRIHIYESQNILQPYKQDATKQGTLMSLAKLSQRFSTTFEEVTTYSTATVPGVQFYNFSQLQVNDTYIPLDFAIQLAGDEINPLYVDDFQTEYDLVHVIKNYQLLDAGYREHVTDYNKRYRELQMKFNNVSQKALKFSTEFTLDGGTRKAFYTYEMHQEIDPLDPNYGVIYLERIPIIDAELPGSTLLGEDQNDTGAWALDNSKFPETVLWKVRTPISGKGYAPKLRLISFNEEKYDLLNVIWVFRMMNSR